MYIAIVYYSICDIIIFKNYHGFLIEPFSYMIKNSEQKLEYLKKKKSFYTEIKSIFHHF